MGIPIEIRSNQQHKWLDYSIEEKLEQVVGSLDLTSWSQCCIYRLPWSMRVEDNNKAYIPRLVSLGPYHYGSGELEAMEFHKCRALCQVLKRNNQDISTYLKAMKDIEEQVRACYEDIPDDFTSGKFAEMLVVDGCFILETLRAYAQGKQGFRELGYPEKDPVFSKDYMTDGILRDMILLENQIPLFVLERLHGLQREAPYQKSVVELAVVVYNPVWVTARGLKNEEFEPLKNHILSLGDRVGLRHCLDIFRQTLMYCQSTPQTLMEERRKKDKEMDPKDQLLPSATRLDEAGVEFKTVKNTFPFWDINFKGRTITIPQIVISDSSESMFLNLMAFEQCHLPPKEARITSYIAVLDNLVDSEDDVAQLIKAEIIIHTLGSNEEVANIINRLGKGIYFSVEDGCYVGFYEALNKYSTRKYNQWRADLRHNYFKSPWAIIAVIAATLELVLSFAQTVKS